MRVMDRIRQIKVRKFIKRIYLHYASMIVLACCGLFLCGCSGDSKETAVDAPNVKQFLPNNDWSC